MLLKIPAPLQRGDRVAISALSASVGVALQPRLDLVLQQLRAQGYEVLEGATLRRDSRIAAPALTRARELQDFLLDERIAAVLPPWGGELASELLDHLDWAALAQARPKWMLGFSDVSTFTLPLLLRAGWASLHSSNLMQLVPAQTDALTSAVLPLLRERERRPWVQAASTHHEVLAPDVVAHPGAPFALTEPTRWRCLNRDEARPLRLRGRLLGGCLDSLCSLAGTAFGEVPAFIRGCGSDGALLFLENAELPPAALIRSLLGLRRNGWFEGLSGLLLGRSPVQRQSTPDRLSYADALQRSLADLPCPVLYDLDIGHLSPQLTLMQGARADLVLADGVATLTQHWD